LIPEQGIICFAGPKFYQEMASELDSDASAKTVIPHNALVALQHQGVEPKMALGESSSIQITRICLNGSNFFC